MPQKIALVTGASRGLGFAMAEQLALQGWQVVAVARTVGGLEDLDDKVKSAGLPGAGALTLAPMDVTDEGAMRHLCRSIHDRWGGLQLWVHAAIHVTALSPAPSGSVSGPSAGWSAGSSCSPTAGGGSTRGQGDGGLLSQRW